MYSCTKKLGKQVNRPEQGEIIKELGKELLGHTVYPTETNVEFVP